MEAQAEHQELEQTSLNPLGLLTLKLAQYGQNASNNFSDAFNRMTLQNWIRLTMIVGGYMLLRPYVLKLSTKVAVKKLEQQEEKEREEEAKLAKMTPNELRGLKDDDEIDEGADGSSADWGSKARIRQRKMLKKLLEEEEERRIDRDDDADIQEFYVE